MCSHRVHLVASILAHDNVSHVFLTERVISRTDDDSAALSHKGGNFTGIVR